MAETKISAKRLPDIIQSTFQKNITLVISAANTVKLVYHAKMKPTVYINGVLRQTSADLTLDVSGCVAQRFYDVYLHWTGAALELTSVVCNPVGIPYNTTSPGSDYTLIGCYFKGWDSYEWVDAVTQKSSLTFKEGVTFGAGLGVNSHLTYFWAVKLMQVPIFKPSEVMHHFTGFGQISTAGVDIELRHDSSIMSAYTDVGGGEVTVTTEIVSKQIHKCYETIGGVGTRSYDIPDLHYPETILTPGFVNRMYGYRVIVATAAPDEFFGAVSAEIKQL